MKHFAWLFILHRSTMLVITVSGLLSHICFLKINHTFGYKVLLYTVEIAAWKTLTLIRSLQNL